MNGRAAPVPAYVDTSLLVAALAPDEPRHLAARQWLAQFSAGLVTSVLAEVELGRALARRDAPPALRAAAAQLLGACELVEVTAEIRAAAARVRPASVRSLDALHVATALVAGLSEFASYDARQRVAAEEAGMAVANAAPASGRGGSPARPVPGR